jgi:hypothetical protein
MLLTQDIWASDPGGVEFHFKQRNGAPPAAEELTAHAHAQQEKDDAKLTATEKKCAAKNKKKHELIIIGHEQNGSQACFLVHLYKFFPSLPRCVHGCD